MPSQRAVGEGPRRPGMVSPWECVGREPQWAWAFLSLLPVPLPHPPLSLPPSWNPVPGETHTGGMGVSRKLIEAATLLEFASYRRVGMATWGCAVCVHMYGYVCMARVGDSDLGHPQSLPRTPPMPQGPPDTCPPASCRTFSMSRTLSCISRRAPSVSVSRSLDCSSSVSRWDTKSSVRRGFSWGRQRAVWGPRPWLASASLPRALQQGEGPRFGASWAGPPDAQSRGPRGPGTHAAGLVQLPSWKGCTEGTF